MSIHQVIELRGVTAAGLRLLHALDCGRITPEELDEIRQVLGAAEDVLQLDYRKARAARVDEVRLALAAECLQLAAEGAPEPAAEVSIRHSSDLYLATVKQEAML